MKNIHGCRFSKALLWGVGKKRPKVDICEKWFLRIAVVRFIEGGCQAAHFLTVSDQHHKTKHIFAPSFNCWLLLLKSIQRIWKD